MFTFFMAFRLAAKRKGRKKFLEIVSKPFVRELARKETLGCGPANVVEEQKNAAEFEGRGSPPPQIQITKDTSCASESKSRSQPTKPRLERSRVRAGRVHVPGVKHEVDAALIVDSGGGDPVNLIRADHARSSANQRIADATVGVAVAGHRQHGTGIQNKHRHTGSAGCISGCRRHVAGDVAAIG